MQVAENGSSSRLDLVSLTSGNGDKASLQSADGGLAFENELDLDDGLDPVMKEELDRYESSSCMQRCKCGGE